MRIGINAQLLSHAGTRGWNRYAVNLIAALAEFDVELFLYSTGAIAPEHAARIKRPNVVVRVAPAMRYHRWLMNWLPGRSAEDRLDVLHSPFNYGIPWKCWAKMVVTIHDAIDQVYYQRTPAWRSMPNRVDTPSGFYHWLARRRADQVITVSEHAKRDLLKHWHIPPGKITAIYEAADPIFTQPVTAEGRASVRKDLELTRPYIFYVGGWERRKNVPFLLRAFAAAELADVDLLLAGGSPNEFAALNELARSLGIGDRVRLRGSVADGELAALYAEALCFVYPSEYEGFGLQLCEAMAIGTPVLASDRTSLPEILGDGGATFSLEDHGELAQLLRQVAHESTFRAELAARARRRSAEFSWKRTATQTLQVYGATASQRDHA